MTRATEGPPPPIQPGGRGEPRRQPRVLGKLLALVLLVLVAAALWLYQQLQASLPQLEGVQDVSGLQAPVRIERDDLGVPTIRGSHRLDVARALAFLHGQDRFFQMDLMRRQAAGELSELFGEGALPTDRRNRVHRFRARAERILDTLSKQERQLFEAYAAGVNTGLESLGAHPFEYLLLTAEPAPWRAEDVLLTVYAMYFELNDETGGRDSMRGLIDDLLGPRMLEFLAPDGTEWDAPVVGPAFATPDIPGPEVLDLRQRPAVARRRAGPSRRSPVSAAGSNSWALAGRHTSHGGSLLANDMHLGHAVPNIWYRASLVYQETAGERRMTGVSLPGTPIVIAGSNGHVAWGFTNTYGDWEDLVILEPAPDGDGDYLTPEGPKTFDVHHEILRVKGGKSETLEVLETIWGPVIDRDHLGRRRVLRWIAHDTRGVTLGLLDLAAAQTVEEAIEIANRVGAPPQNFVVADAGKRIGWTIMGAIPRRFGYDGRLPTSWADGSRGWDGWLEPKEYPRILDPEEGRFWSANNRIVDGEWLAKIGRASYTLGARARQIRDRLRALESASESDLLSIQLDDRALFLERWRELLLEVLTPAAVTADSRRRELRRHVEEWGGRASVDSVGYRMVRAFRLFLAEQVFDAITAPCKEADERFDHDRLLQREGPLWRLVSERPPHLLDPRFESWQEQFLSAVDATLDYFAQDARPLNERTWGDRNTTRIRHPLSAFLPGLGRWLDMPSIPLPGDSHMPRYQAPAEGASQRMVVSPGREEEGIFHMPTGQSGHPLSPHYRDGHQAWAEGKATPFLPGPTVHTLVLRPSG